jgi:hypothetical protein
MITIHSNCQEADERLLDPTYGGAAKMSDKVLISLTNAAPGQELEFNTWFDEHVLEVLQVDGVVSARRFELSGAQLDGAPASDHQYLAIYEIEGDTEAVLGRMLARRRDGLNVPKRGIDDSVTKIWAFDQLGPTGVPVTR